MIPGLVLRLVAAAALAAIWSLLYGWLNRLGSTSERVAMWTGPLERWPRLYVPEISPVYFFLGLGLPLAPLFVLTGRNEFYKTLIGYTIVGMMCLATYAAYPVKMDRPTYEGDRFGEGLMRFVASVDHPANCLPSSHAAFVIAAAMAITLGGAAVWIQTAAWGVAALVVLSTVLVGQHYIIDGVLGAAVGAGGVALAWRLIPTFQP